MTMRLGLAVLVALLVAPGCAGKTPAPEAPKAPTCDDVAAHARKVVVDSGDAALQPGADKVAADVRDECTTWTAKQACVLAAVTPQDLVGCRVAVEAPGLATCEKAADHALELMMSSDEMKQASPEEQQMAKDMLAGLRGEIIKQCEEKPWPREVVQCVMDAKAMADLERCDAGE